MISSSKSSARHNSIKWCQSRPFRAKRDDETTDRRGPVLVSEGGQFLLSLDKCSTADRSSRVQNRPFRHRRSLAIAQSATYAVISSPRRSYARVVMQPRPGLSTPLDHLGFRGCHDERDDLRGAETGQTDASRIQIVSLDDGQEFRPCQRLKLCSQHV